MLKKSVSVKLKLEIPKQKYNNFIPSHYIFMIFLLNLVDNLNMK